MKQSTEWEIIFENHIADKRFVSRLLTNSYSLTIKIQVTI